VGTKCLKFLLLPIAECGLSFVAAVIGLEKGLQLSMKASHIQFKRSIHLRPLNSNVLSFSFIRMILKPYFYNYKNFRIFILTFTG
jgi:hypothetical protein